ncbi:hypothetical protein QFZ57_003167 [Arthrobacter sp. B1I2]|nr:hypothetical protein [Arthrobacter sp. B1I2]
MIVTPNAVFEERFSAAELTPRRGKNTAAASPDKDLHLTITNPDVAVPSSMPRMIEVTRPPSAPRRAGIPRR